MLGLGSTLVNGGTPSETPFSFTYTSDFTSSADSWEYSATSAPQANTISFNQTGPDATGGWLKIEFTEDHGVPLTWEMRRSLSDQDPVYSEAKEGDEVEWGITLYFDASAGDVWTGTDDIAIQRLGVSPKVRAYSAAQDTVLNIDEGLTHTFLSGTSYFRIRFAVSSDYPNTGAVLWIKNASCTVSGVR